MYAIADEIYAILYSLYAYFNPLFHISDELIDHLHSIVATSESPYALPSLPTNIAIGVT